MIGDLAKTQLVVMRASLYRVTFPQSLLQRADQVIE